MNPNRGLLLALALAACGEPEATVSPPPPVDTTPVPRFVPETPTAPALALAGTIDGDHLDVTIVADAVPAVFGLRVWLTYEGVDLEAATFEPALDPDARYAIVEHPRGVSIGGTRLDPSRGDRPLDNAVAHARLRITEGTPARLALDGLVAKRADGTDVVLALGGARVEWSEAP